MSVAIQNVEPTGKSSRVKVAVHKRETIRRGVGAYLASSVKHDSDLTCALVAHLNHVVVAIVAASISIPCTPVHAAGECRRVPRRGIRSDWVIEGIPGVRAADV